MRTLMLFVSVATLIIGCGDASESTKSEDTAEGFAGPDIDDTDDTALIEQISEDLYPVFLPLCCLWNQRITST